MTEFLTDALEYAERGFSVIPIRHRDASGKQPAIRSWKPYAVTAALPGRLRIWFNQSDISGLAVILGDVSGGLTVRDFDEAEAYRRWAAAHPDLAEALPTVRTARGFHVWCRSDARQGVKYPDGEFRAGGQYVLAPPSRHPSGATYEWLVPLPAIGEPLPFIDADEAGLRRAWPSDEIESDGATDMASVVSVDSVGSVGSVTLCSLCHTTPREAIAATLPKRAGQRNNSLFDLARTLKGMPAYSEAEPAALRNIVKEWHRLALPVIDTEPFDETWADFIRAWGRVKYPKGNEPMTRIIESASKSDAPAWAADRFDCPSTIRLVVLCRELHRAAGGGRWFLACRTAAQVLGVDRMKAWKRLHLLEAEGILSADERGHVGGYRATRYRYTGPDACTLTVETVTACQSA